MEKPQISTNLTAEKIAQLQADDHVFKMHDNKKIIGKADQDGYLIIWLEDGSEIIRNADGEFVKEWGA